MSSDEQVERASIDAERLQCPGDYEGTDGLRRDWREGVHCGGLFFVGRSAHDDDAHIGESADPC